MVPALLGVAAAAAGLGLGTGDAAAGGGVLLPPSENVLQPGLRVLGDDAVFKYPQRPS
jgi:hypothetical protein